jgi:hypothetical protein
VAAVGVATASAPNRLFIDQLVTKSSAATSAVGLSFETVLGAFAGCDVVVVVLVVVVVVVVDVDASARTEGASWE